MEHNISALIDQIRQANRNITAFQKQATDAESWAATTVLTITKELDATLKTLKATFDKFILELLDKIESEFNK
jgi:hypothetical protein